MFLPGFVLQEAAPKYASFEPASTAITSASRSNTRRHLSKIQTQLATPQGDERALLRNQDPDPHSTAGTSTHKFGAFTTGRREVASSFTRFFTVYRKNKILPANGPGLAALCGVRPKTVPPSPATGSNLWVPFSLTLLTDAYGKVGKPGEGLACLDDAACSIEVTQKHSTEAELCKIRGELLSIVA